MGNKGKAKITSQEALVRFLSQLDNQVAREMQRTPAEREKAGVQKWDAYRTRVERITGEVLEQFTVGEVGLDGLLISAESFVRVLRILAEELGEDGLGKVRAGYVRELFKQVERDILLVKESLEGTGEEALN